VHAVADELKEIVKELPDLISLNHDGHSTHAKRPIFHLAEFNQLLPRKVIDVWAKGKKIIFDLDGIYMISSLIMTGKWVEEAGMHSNLWLSFGYCFEGKGCHGQDLLVKVIEKILYFDDLRHFGTMAVCLSRAELQSHLVDIGPDLVSDEIPSELWLQIFRHPKIQQKEITAMLLEQNLVSGIGNYLRAEILYRARIHPGRLIRDLSDEELETIRVHSLQTLNESYLANGHTERTFIGVRRGRGRFICVVYNHERDPHGNKVNKTTFKDGRTTWWVPALQK
jgi:formamidopyrimidine-DNA glycosylase